MIDAVTEFVLAESGNNRPMALPTRKLTALMVDASSFSLPYDYSLCEALATQGHRIILAHSEFREARWQRRAVGFETWNQFYSRTGRDPIKIRKAAEHLIDMRSFVRRVRAVAPDVIHFQWLPVPLLDGLFLGQLATIAPIVFTVHNTQPHGTPIQRFYQTLAWKSLFGHVKAVIVHSEFTRRQIADQAWSPVEKIHVVPHGILDYYRSLDFDRSETAPGATPDRYILFFGCIEPYKGLDVLLRAFSQLPQELLQNTRLMVAGKPHLDVQPLYRLAGDLGIAERVNWRLEYIPEEQVPQLFRSAALVALPYRSIDQSGVLMTAIAFEKAIVASKIGGIGEVLKDGTSALLVPPNDPEALAVRLRELLMHDELRRSMERATARLSTEELSWSASARKTLAVYNQTIRQGTT